MDQPLKIESLSVMGLKGRVLRIPSQKKNGRNMLIIYGLHSSIERMKTTAEFHSQFGSVVMPDLPGFGGMDSFYKINRLPSLDSYADYLKQLIESEKFEGKITIISMSFGSLIVTRALQKYSELTKLIEDHVSVVGFAKHTDFTYSPSRKKFFIGLTKTFKTAFGAWFIKWFVFNPVSLRIMFAIFGTFNPKYQHTLGERKKEALKMEHELWTKNDARTKFYTYELILTVDLTKHGSKIKLPVHNMYTATDQYFGQERVKESLSKVYEKYLPSEATTAVHAPSVLGTLDEIDAMYSSDIKKLLSTP